MTYNREEVAAEADAIARDIETAWAEGGRASAYEVARTHGMPLGIWYFIAERRRYTR